MLTEKQPEDKKSMKSGIQGVILVLVVLMITPILIASITGVDIETLCRTDKNDVERCVENEEIQEGVSEAWFYGYIAIAGISGVGFLVVFVKY